MSCLLTVTLHIVDVRLTCLLTYLRTYFAASFYLLVSFSYIYLLSVSSLEITRAHIHTHTHLHSLAHIEEFRENTENLSPGPPGIVSS